MHWLWKPLLGITFLFILLVGILAVVDNSQPVSLKFLGWQTPEISVFWWLLIALVSGVLLGAISMFFSTLRLKVNHRRLQRQLRNCENENKRLRDQNLVG